MNKRKIWTSENTYRWSTSEDDLLEVIQQNTLRREKEGSLSSQVSIEKYGAIVRKGLDSLIRLRTNLN